MTTKKFLLSFVLAGLLVSCSDAKKDEKDDKTTQPVATGQSEKADVMSDENIAFLEENAKKDGVLVTESGLQYKILQEGSDKKAGPSDTVRVHYVGKLVDGTVFDSSIERGEPIEFALDQVIRGWGEGMQLVGEGGKIELVVPADLGYGDAGVGPIPGGATLVFEVEVLNVKSDAEVSAAQQTYLDEHAKKDGVTVTESGLQYKIIEAGNDKKPGANDVVSMHFTGQLIDGMLWGDSRQQGREVVTGLAGVFPGWAEGVQMIGEGGKIELVMPASIGLGPQDQGPIPGGSTLVMTVELLTVKTAEEMEAEQAGFVAEQQAYLDENAKKEGVTVTASGLQYRVINAGTGKALDREDNQVTVHYAGRLIDGTEFDSSYGRGQPAQFPANRLIAGWVEALQLMKEGDKWELTIPSDIAYGPQGTGNIPPHATLVFDIELISVDD